MSLKRFDQLVGELRSCLADLSDKRTGTNTQYSMETIGLSAFSVFFTQCPSFLAYQKAMEKNKGQSNAQTLFQIEKTPTDNHPAPAGRPARSGRAQGALSRVRQHL